MTKFIYQKPSTNIFNGKTLRVFSFKSETKQECPLKLVQTKANAIR